jgi:ABC-type phosphate transport system auxiliary subunit
MNEDTEDQIPAQQWRQLRLALSDRLQSLVEARREAGSDAEREELGKRIEQVKEQVKALTLEENVAQFVEDAERYIIAASTLAEDLRRDPDQEIA